MINIMTHKIVFKVEFQCFWLIWCIFPYYSIKSALYFMLQYLMTGIFSTILHNKQQSFCLLLDQIICCFYYRFQNMDLPTLVTAYLIHPQINDYNISHSKAKKCNLPLYYSLFICSLYWVKTFCIDDIKPSIILNPYSFCTSFSIFQSIQYRKMCTKSSIDKRTFPWTLRTKYSYISYRIWKLS